MLGIGWLATLLYIDAFISPAGTGLIYTGSSSRLTYGMGRNGYIPHFFDRLNDRGVPWIIYSGQCVSVAALRKQLPDVERPFCSRRWRWASSCWGPRT